jgi:hypothetical protein
MTKQTMTKQMEISRTLFEASIPNPFTLTVAGVISPHVQPYQVPNNTQAQPAGTPP